MKKAEMSMAMIIGAVIAVIILVILVFLLTRSSNSFSDSTKCVEKGKVCKSYNDAFGQSDCETGLCGDSDKLCCPIIS